VPVSSKSGKVHRKHTGKTVQNGIKELKLIRPYTFSGVEESHDIEHKNENEEMKEYVRRLRLI